MKHVYIIASAVLVSLAASGDVADAYDGPMLAAGIVVGFTALDEIVNG